MEEVACQKEENFSLLSSSSIISATVLNLMQTTPLMKNGNNIDKMDSTEGNTEEGNKEYTYPTNVSEEIILRALPFIPREQLFERDFSLRQVFFIYYGKSLTKNFYMLKIFN